MGKGKTTGKQPLFDAENAAQELSKAGNPPEILDSVTGVGVLRSEPEATRVDHGAMRNVGGRKYDMVMMFEVMVLRRYSNLSYGHTECQISHSVSNVLTITGCRAGKGVLSAW